MKELVRKTKKKKILGNLGLFTVVAILPLVLNMLGFSYGITILVFISIYIVAVSGLDILFGYSGQISMGHAAFYAIGAYGSAILSRYCQVPVIFGMIIAPLIAALVGAVLAYPASKLLFHFLSLATIAFGEIVYQIVLQSPRGITGNAVGLSTKAINVFGFLFTSNVHLYYICMAFLVMFLIAKANLVNSRVGRAFIAIRENSHAAEGMGIDVRKYKIMAFATSAFFTAFAGGMYAHAVGYISPDTFTNKQSVIFVTMLLFGGTASKWGPVIGAISVLLLNELLRMMENMQMLIYGVLLLVVILALPGGISGVIKDIYYKTRKRRSGKC